MLLKKYILKYMTEMKLSRIAGALKKGHSVGTVSPERGHMDDAAKKAAHKKMQDQLGRESKKGMISYSGPHAGRYKYSDTDEPAKEGSYVLKPGNHPKAKDNFHRILTRMGKKHDQESVLKVHKTGKGSLHYTAGKDKGKSVKLGKIHYNRPLTTGGGDTKLRGSNSSFTVKPDAKN
jgi:hypothetical protein